MRNQEGEPVMSSQDGEARNEEPGRRYKNCRARKEEPETGRLKKKSGMRSQKG
jgi:hypothetical protein